MTNQYKLGDADAKPNVVLIVMDSVRASFLSAYGYKKPTSPRLEELAREGVLYEDVWSTGCQSQPSHASMMTGTYPSRHNVLEAKSNLGDTHATLAELLAEQGYRTVGLSNKYDISKKAGFARGFDKFINLHSRHVWPWDGVRFRFKKATRNLGGRIDNGAKVTNRMARRHFRKARSRQQPLFLFINYADAHYPFYGVGRHRSTFCSTTPTRAELKRAFDLCWKSDDYVFGNIDISEEEFQLLRSLYEGSIAYLDHRIGELIDTLQAEGVFENTLWVVCSDHGECFGEHRLFLHSHHLYEQLLRVPLILRYPGRFEGGTRIAFPAQVCDIFHSILETVGIEAPVDPLGGQALPNHNDANSNGRLRVAEYIDKRAVRRDSMKLILHEKGPRELYDLDADPEELNNLAKERPEVVAEFEKAVAAWINQATKT